MKPWNPTKLIILLKKKKFISLKLLIIQQPLFIYYLIHLIIDYVNDAISHV
jgi:hypothetical protein